MRNERKTYSSSIKCRRRRSHRSAHGATRVKRNSRSMENNRLFHRFFCVLFFGSTDIEIVLSRKESKNAPKIKLPGGRGGGGVEPNGIYAVCVAFLFGSVNVIFLRNSSYSSFCFCLRSLQMPLLHFFSSYLRFCL